LRLLFFMLQYRNNPFHNFEVRNLQVDV
jgi:hypothetical protein